MKGPCRILQVLSLPEMYNKQGVFPDNAMQEGALLAPQVMIWSFHEPKMNIESNRKINLGRIKWFIFHKYLVAAT